MIARPFVGDSGGLPSLEAEANASRPDLDGDGVPDMQEFVLGTDPYTADSDQDGFSDLEELAGRSDPLDDTVTPSKSSLTVGMYAYTQDDMLHLSSAVYVPDGKLKGLGFELGMVLPDGTPAKISMNRYRTAGQAFIYGSSYGPAEKIVVLEYPIPTTIIHQLQSFNLYARVQDQTGSGRGSSADVASFVDMNGEIGRVEYAPKSVQGGSGIIYRPLSGTGPPSSWQSGEVCWQKTSPAGTNGVNLVYEIDEASCEEMDSYCDGAECAGSVGTTREIPDPGALLGG